MLARHAVSIGMTRQNARHTQEIPYQALAGALCCHIEGRDLAEDLAQKGNAVPPLLAISPRRAVETALRRRYMNWP